ncbi:hypothetical protein B0H17DRAFT_1127083 [Mycena rosella]|uniref:Uncharacterized protein n=1 Tax=Mycena rosella TaxID=1033263 RepID=A0AAD7M701_MYCRO|nr:hypothetical protein B0H17DRAFT_1127083 [Mycena rosella]
MSLGGHTESRELPENPGAGAPMQAKAELLLQGLSIVRAEPLPAGNSLAELISVLGGAFVLYKSDMDWARSAAEGATTGLPLEHHPLPPSRSLTQWTYSGRDFQGFIPNLSHPSDQLLESKMGGEAPEDVEGVGGPSNDKQASSKENTHFHWRVTLGPNTRGSHAWVGPPFGQSKNDASRNASIWRITCRVNLPYVKLGQKSRLGEEGITCEKWKTRWNGMGLAFLGTVRKRGIFGWSRRSRLGQVLETYGCLHERTGDARQDALLDST